LILKQHRLGANLHAIFFVSIEILFSKQARFLTETFLPLSDILYEAKPDILGLIHAQPPINQKLRNSRDFSLVVSRLLKTLKHSTINNAHDNRFLPRHFGFLP
jgi:hypothetical protein